MSNVWPGAPRHLKRPRLQAPCLINGLWGQVLRALGGQCSGAQAAAWPGLRQHQAPGALFCAHDAFMNRESTVSTLHGTSPSYARTHFLFEIISLEDTSFLQ